MRKALAMMCGLVVFGTAGCSSAAGAVVEGRASQVHPSSTPSTTASGTAASADSVAVLRADPQISAEVKAKLAPCPGGEYPTLDRYVDLTGDGTDELLVTLLSCPTGERAAKVAVGGSGYAGYVYNLATNPPTRLFGVEGADLDMVPLIGAAGPGNQLAVLRSADPTGQTFWLYKWNGSQLVEGQL